MAMDCPNCQNKVTDDSRFCSMCGSSIHSSDEIDLSQTRTILSSMEALAPGTIISEKYKIIEILGRGGMGIVYKAEDIKLKRAIALKFLSVGLTQNSEARERFIQEAQAASALDHPNICNIHEIGETENGQMFIAMAFYEGETLKDRINRGPLEFKEALEISSQISQGLAKAHEKGIVHRDIKPVNIIISKDGMAKILDFGIAKLTGATRITKTKATMGTTAYMSPEQARGDNVDLRTDVWSLGVVLYEMISGQLPFSGESEQAIVHNILNKEPKPIKDLPASIPSEFRQIIQKALSKNQEKRYSSAEELFQALHDLNLKLISGTRLITKGMTFRKPRSRILIGSAALVFVLATILVTWILTKPSLAFRERDKLLVADVDNQTGDAVFDMALRTAIEADLQQSPYASIFDKAQVAETLKLMRMDPSSHIDEELGYDVCRFSGIRAMILPRISSAGEAYELQAVLIDPKRKRHVDRIRVTALGREEVLLTAIDKLARQLRSRLGESLGSIEEADKAVVQLTTSSWEALNYVSIGQTKWHEGKFKEAASFFELALEKDPKFVGARGSLGLVLIQFLNQKEKGQEELKQALEDAENITQQEYILIKALNLWYVDEDHEAALQEYQICRELFPEAMQAYNNSGVILRELGRIDEAVTMFEKAADVAPKSGNPLANLWWTHLTYRKDAVSAEEAARRVVALGPEIAIHHHWLGYALAAQARFDESVEAYSEVLSLESQHPWGLPNMAFILLAAGRAKEAVPYFQEILELNKLGRWQGYVPLSCFNLAMALRESGDAEAAKAAAEEGKSDLLEKVGESWDQAWIPLLLAKLEITGSKESVVDEYIDQAKSLGLNDQGANIYLAEVFALTGKHQEAIALLRQVLESGHDDPFFLLIYPAFQSIRNDPDFLALFGISRK
jgi:serine/threonine protein kinase/Flp pilus assembly protein TadD